MEGCELEYRTHDFELDHMPNFHHDCSICNSMTMQSNIRLVNSLIMIVSNCAKLRDPTSRVAIKFILLINTIENILNSDIIFDNTVNIAIKIEISIAILVVTPVVRGINTIMFILCVFGAIYGIGLILYIRLDNTLCIFTFEKGKKTHKKNKNKENLLFVTLYFMSCFLYL